MSPSKNEASLDVRSKGGRSFRKHERFWRLSRLQGNCVSQGQSISTQVLDQRCYCRDSQS